MVNKENIAQDCFLVLLSPFDFASASCSKCSNWTRFMVDKERIPKAKSREKNWRCFTFFFLSTFSSSFCLSMKALNKMLEMLCAKGILMTLILNSPSIPQQYFLGGFLFFLFVLFLWVSKALLIKERDTWLSYASCDYCSSAAWVPMLWLVHHVHSFYCFCCVRGKRLPNNFTSKPFCCFCTFHGSIDSHSYLLPLIGINNLFLLVGGLSHVTTINAHFFSSKSAIYLLFRSMVSGRYILRMIVVVVCVQQHI